MSSIDNNFNNSVIKFDENKKDINKEYVNNVDNENIKKLKNIISFKKEENKLLKKESFKIINEEVGEARNKEIINYDKVKIEFVDDEKENQDYTINWASLSEEDVKELLNDSFKRCHRTIVCCYLIEEYKKEPTQKKAEYILKKFLDPNGRFGINYGKKEVGEIIKNANEKIFSLNKEESNKKKGKGITKFFSDIIYKKSREDLRKTKSFIENTENMDKKLFDGVLSCNSDYFREAFTYLSWKKTKEKKKKLLESVKDKNIIIDKHSLKKENEKDISTNKKRLSFYSNSIGKEMRTFYDGAKEAGFNIPKIC